jgi:hypothetical protein
VSEPSSVAPWKNCTREIVPSESEAVAVKLMVEPGLKNAPFAGPVSVTAGGAFTLIVRALEVAIAPVLSVALAVIV